MNGYFHDTSPTIATMSTMLITWSSKISIDTFQRQSTAGFFEDFQSPSPSEHPKTLKCCLYLGLCNKRYILPLQQNPSQLSSIVFLYMHLHSIVNDQVHELIKPLTVSFHVCNHSKYERWRIGGCVPWFSLRYDNPLVQIAKFELWHAVAGVWIWGSRYQYDCNFKL